MSTKETKDEEKTRKRRDRNSRKLLLSRMYGEKAAAEIEGKADEIRITEEVERFKRDGSRFKMSIQEKQRYEESRGELNRILKKLSGERTAIENKFLEEAYRSSRKGRNNLGGGLNLLREKHGQAGHSSDGSTMLPPALNEILRLLRREKQGRADENHSDGPTKLPPTLEERLRLLREKRVRDRSDGPTKLPPLPKPIIPNFATKKSAQLEMRQKTDLPNSELLGSNRRQQISRSPAAGSQYAKDASLVASLVLQQRDNPTPLFAETQLPVGHAAATNSILGLNSATFSSSYYQNYNQQLTALPLLQQNPFEHHQNYGLPHWVGLSHQLPSNLSTFSGGTTNNMFGGGDSWQEHDFMIAQQQYQHEYQRSFAAAVQADAVLMTMRRQRQEEEQQQHDIMLAAHLTALQQGTTTRPSAVVEATLYNHAAAAAGQDTDILEEQQLDPFSPPSSLIWCKGPASQQHY